MQENIAPQKQIAIRRYARTPERKILHNTWQLKRNLKLKPLQERSWWAALPEVHQHLFLTEFNPETQTINEFKAYLNQLPKQQRHSIQPLAEEQVREIKHALKNGVPGVPDRNVVTYLAKAYSVCRQTIYNIRDGKIFKYI